MSIGLASSARTSFLVLASFSSLDALADVEVAALGPSTRTSSEVVVLDRVVVAESSDPLLKRVRLASVAVEKIPGTASVVDVSDVRRGRAANAEDLLALLPGVYAQATSGASANKISIRGSGLNTFYQGYSLGTKYLYDGQPVTGPGGTQEELLAASGLSHVEILNGPNAFQYASTSLGGAINFVTHTGRTAPGAEVRLEAGDFGYRRAEATFGGFSGATDYFVGAIHTERKGFQINTPNNGDTLIVNLGHRFNERLDTRLILRYQREEVHNGSTLTQEQIDQDPSQNNTVGFARPALVLPDSGTPPLTLARGAQSARRKEGTTVVASKTSVAIDADSRLEVGFSNTNYPLANGWLYSLTPQDWRSNDFNTTLRYTRSDELFGLPLSTTGILSDTRLTFGDVHGYNDPRNGTPRTLAQYTEFSGSRDTVFAIAGELEVVPRHLWLTAGLSYAELDRDVRILFTTGVSNPTTNPAGYPQSVSYVDRSFLPRVGIRYAVNEKIQLFSSVSKAVDAPVTWQMGSTGNPYVRPLRPQEATTVEAGIRGQALFLEGSLTLYRAWLDHELLTVRDPAFPVSDPRGVINTNASPTIHQGIEAALTSRLWTSAGNDRTRLSLRQAYTFNDFYFEGDPSWKKNQLPSIPEHTYQAELLFDHESGFYTAVTTRFASSYFIDFANSVSADDYIIFGAKVGYKVGRWSAFVDLRNLTDEHYATAANTVPNANGNARTAANFYPGDTFNVIGGVTVRF